MRDLQTVDLADLIPPSIASDPQVQAAVQALNGELQSCTAQIQQAVLIARIDELDSSTLDQLAWHYNVLFYDDGGTLTQKRAAIKRAIYWRRIAGTKGAVEEGISALQYKPEVIEWWQFGGEPYTFKVIADVTGQSVSDGIYTQVERVVELTKNTRSHLVGVTIRSNVEGKIYIAAAVATGEETTIYPYSPANAPVYGALRMFAGMYGADVTTIYPGERVENGAFINEDFILYGPGLLIGTAKLLTQE